MRQLIGHSSSFIILQQLHSVQAGKEADSKENFWTWQTQVPWMESIWHFKTLRHIYTFSCIIGSRVAQMLITGPHKSDLEIALLEHIMFARSSRLRMDFKL